MTPMLAVASGSGIPRLDETDDSPREPKNGNCKDPTCGKRASVLVDGYCIHCIGKNKVDTMKGCGNAINLLEDAAAGGSELNP